MQTLVDSAVVVIAVVIPTLGLQELKKIVHIGLAKFLGEGGTPKLI